MKRGGGGRRESEKRMEDIPSLPYTYAYTSSRSLLNDNAENRVLALGHDGMQGPWAHRREASAVEIDESNIEWKARRVLREEMRKKLAKWRVREVVPRDDDKATRKLSELEGLRKMAHGGCD